jgi:predicted NAD/FAD-dependent oxidoreductase
MGHRIAIVGAGVAGLAAALRLTEAGEAVVVYEKSRGLSGRAATRTKEGCRYDFGANYFKVGCNEVAKLVFETLPTDGLTRIVGDILAFNRDGKVSPADPERNAGARWTYRDGISTLGKRLAAKGGFTIANEVCVTRLKRAGGCWQLEDGAGKPLGDFDRVLLTSPAPQAADLLEASDFPSPVRMGVVAGLRRAEYWRQFSVVLSFPEAISLPGNAYALINEDRDHDLAWVSLENRKADRVPAGQSLFVLQLSPRWSERHYEDAPASIVSFATAQLRSLLGEDLPAPAWSDLQRWRYAHPRTAADASALREGASHGLFFAGDCLVGRGRVEEAILTGFAAASEMAILRI